MVLGNYSLQAIIGTILLFTNQPVGWGGIFFCSYLAKKTGRKVFYAMGTGFYVFSWIMLVTGAVLVGPDELQLLRGAMATHQWLTVCLFSAVLAGVTWYAIRKRKKERSAVQG